LHLSGLLGTLHNPVSEGRLTEGFRTHDFALLG
jgi:hypothetical protein